MSAASEDLIEALWSWKGAPADMVIHMRDEMEGAPVPSSGSGKRLRARARALLAALEERSRPAPSPLYRGSHDEPSGILSWSTRRQTAEHWARKNHGQVWELPAGTLGLRISSYLGSDPEREWIVWTP